MATIIPALVTHPEQTTAELTFEDAMERLEEIVAAMEAERLPLEEMVQSYEEGSQLLKVCRARIETARQRVELITTRLDEPAAPATLTPFDPARASEADPSDEPSRTAAARTPARRTTSKPAAAADEDDIRLF